MGRGFCHVEARTMIDGVQALEKFHAKAVVGRQEAFSMFFKPHFYGEAEDKGEAKKAR